MARIQSGRPGGRVPGPRDNGEDGEDFQEPKPRQRQTVAVPVITVVGRIDDKYAVRAPWDQTIHQVSARQMKFMEEVMGLIVADDESSYVM